MRIFHVALLTLIVSAVLPFAVQAETVDEIVTLAQKNVGEDVLIATVSNSKSDFNLSAQDIIKLKNANVPNTVITAMLKHHGTGVAAAPAPTPAPAPWPGPAAAPEAVAPPAPPAPRATVEAGDGKLDLENLDDRAWSYRYEPAVGTIWIVPAERSGRMPPNGNISLSMRTGTYAIRFSGSNEKGATVTVYKDRKSQVLISRVNTEQLEAMYVSVFENGEKKSGARLAVFRDGAVAAQPNTHVNVPPTEYVTPAPQTTIIYREPVYVGPPPLVYAPGYYRPYYYYPRNTVNFGYYHGGRHSGVGVGLGFGF